VPLCELSRDAARDALPFRESSEPKHWSNLSGARIWSSGERATTSANFALASKNPKRQKVRVKLASTHPVASTATPTPVTFSFKAPKVSSRKCGFCKKPGHNQKTCTKKVAAGTNPNTVTLGAAVEAAASTAVAVADLGNGDVAIAAGDASRSVVQATVGVDSNAPLQREPELADEGNKVRLHGFL